MQGEECSDQGKSQSCCPEAAAELTLKSQGRFTDIGSLWPSQGHADLRLPLRFKRDIISYSTEYPYRYGVLGVS